MGYAFVNFMYIEDLLIFAKSKLGVKWCADSLHIHWYIFIEVYHLLCPSRNMFSSKKVLQLSYANYQYVMHLHSIGFKINDFWAGEKKHSSKSSRILALWTRMRHGAPKFSVQSLDPSRVYQNCSHLLLILGGRNAVLSIVGSCSFPEII